MEIRLGWPGSDPTPVVVTMRTPGADFELAVGFLASEGLIDSGDQVRRVRYCTDAEQMYNVVTVDLAGPPKRPPARRYGAATAACGVCGRESLDELELRGHRPLTDDLTVAPDLLRELPDRLLTGQGVFRRTGGLHASALFTSDGEQVCLREDVGRHNALDKAIGWAVLHDRLPLAGHVLVVSGRAGYEICQKALAAGIPFVAAVGAPSSIAVDLAERFGMTLVGFLRGSRFVVYAGAHRVRL